ncbi:MAG: hypothetical protein NXH95_02900 [Pseudomonadaceae bacterium]|nr:hypothetical protein [Pseudomonadaceae bacterium]
MFLFKHALQLAVLFLLLGVSAVNAQEFLAPEAESSGEIQGLDFGTYRAVVNGTDYDVSPTCQVQINGTFGAFTMLEEGMFIEFTFLHYADGARVINSIVEVDSVEGV